MGKVKKHKARTDFAASDGVCRAHLNHYEAWQWQNHAVGIIFFSRDREAIQWEDGQSWKKTCWMMEKTWNWSGGSTNIRTRTRNTQEDI